MSYYYGSYQQEGHYQASLPQNLPLYRGPQNTYNYGENHNKEMHSASGMNSGLQMVPQLQYYNVQHAPVYHQSSRQSSLSSSQSYPQLQPQYASRHVGHRLGFDVTHQRQRNVYIPPEVPVPNDDPLTYLQLAQSTFYASTDLREPTPNSSAPDTNVLDGLPPLIRIRGRKSIPRWQPQKVQTAKPRIHPQFSLSAQPKGSIKGSNRDWSTLQPGAVHTLISFLSSSHLPEYLQDAATHRDSVIYLPRCSEFSGKDKDPRACISFSVDGMPGPYLLDLAEGRVVIDGEDDKIFEKFGWRSTKIQIDWPGLSMPPEGLRVDSEDGRPLRRGELATILATRIAKTIINTQRGYALPMGETQRLSGSAKYWDIMKADCSHLRLISVNLYDKVWVPVLALDIAAYNM